jgi:hypothetical protein
MRPRLDLWDAPLRRRLQPIRCHYVSDGGCAPVTPLSCETPSLFRGPGSHVIHECRRKAIIGLQIQLLKPRPDGIHIRRVESAFDNRGHEGGETRFSPADFLEAFGMNEGQSLERMLSLHWPIHVHAALVARVTKDGRGRIDDNKLVPILKHFHVLCWHDCDDRKIGACRLPAFGAAAYVIMRNVMLDVELYRILGARANQRPTQKGRACYLPPRVN